ncbi:inositol monophosphatase family protein [Chachezhania sediminis]|uniref:inositol monophosphatase family protein n=1 Tax=Chachezhania sediminis TaxID=2599291 RepID=UPI00131AB42F|nr:inositol monophosphatase family protein [Chachezhania sediminis]
MSDTTEPTDDQTATTGQNDPDDLAVAHRLADAARSAILPWFRAGTLVADNKATQGFDPVTEADRASEVAMRALLAELRPDDGVWGEEMGQTEGTSGRIWVLDPIDGTRGFLSGTPTWGVLIALARAGAVPEPILGMVDQPYIGERFFGGIDVPPEVHGPLGRAALSTRPTARLEDAILFTTFPEVGTKAEGQAFRRVADRVRLVRYGMDCYAYALLAAGQIDLVIEAGLYAYDVLGPMGVIQAAGGIVTDWQGGPAGNGGQVVAAANVELHRAALELLQDRTSH